MNWRKFWIRCAWFGHAEAVHEHCPRCGWVASYCDEHEWAGYGFCPKCRRRIQRQARRTAELAKKLGWKAPKAVKTSGDKL